jgi:hypothetical protein
MVDVWEVEVGDDAQLRDDLAEECRTASSDFAIIERMIKAALIGSLVGASPEANDAHGAGIIIAFRPPRAGH